VNIALALVALLVVGAVTLGVAALVLLVRLLFTSTSTVKEH
jgi:DMSO/TMAO reductase YedYZ heme-binding membrane subunit